MKYFIDTEFHEYSKQQKICGIKIGQPIPTIDLISIGIVSEDGKEYYAISKDFNLKDAWNSYQIDTCDRMGNLYSTPKKVYWLRNNVLLPIHYELASKEVNTPPFDVWKVVITAREYGVYGDRHYSTLKRLINKYGKTNKQIAEEVKEFVNHTGFEADPVVHSHKVNEKKNIQFYGYYADYDWVVFCKLYGKMIDLPKGFPMYCRDLKQMMDDKGLDNKWKRDNCPDPIGEHNALIDAKWNLKLFNKIHEIYNK